MISTIEEFVQLLTDSGLMTAAEVFAHQDSLPPKKRPVSAEALAESLVESEKLTAYQSAQLLKGRYEGLVLGDYVILEKIGGGGMGDVFKALHSRMKRVVALKTLPPRSIEVWEGTGRFQREIEAAAKLEHPNIVAAYDAGEARNIHFLVMQYIDGADLHAVVSARGPLAIEDAVGLVVQVARGLEYAHSQHVIHRDIKPSNILVDRSGTAKIVDMGLARLREASPAELPARRLTLDGETMGTADFMSPEQATDAHRADERSDIYSLGCTLYFLLTGKSLYRKESVEQTIRSHIKKPIPSIRAVRREVPRQLESVYRKMVAKKPESRHQSMSEVLQALAVFAPVEQPALSGTGRSGVSVDPHATNIYMEADSIRTFMTHATARDETSTGGHRRLGETGTMVPSRRKRWAVWIGLALLVVIAAGLIVWDPYGNVVVEQPDEPPGETLSSDSDPGANPQPHPAIDDPRDPLDEVLEGFVHALEGHAKRVNAIAFSPLGEIAASASADGTASLWSWQTGDHIVDLKKHESAVTAVAFSPDGKRLVTACGDGALRLWDGRDGKLMKELPKSRDGGLLCAVFLPDSQQVLTGGWNSPIRLWDVEAGHEVRQLKGVRDDVYSIAIDGDGKRALSGAADGRVTVWNVENGENGEEIHKFVGHQREVKSVAFSPDGSRAASASWDDTVGVWDPRNGRAMTDEVPSVKLVKPTSVAFLADGRRIVFGDRTKSIYVWDLAAKEQVAKFDIKHPVVESEDELNVDCLAVSPDGQYLLSGTTGGAIYLWRLPTMDEPEAP